MRNTWMSAPATLTSSCGKPFIADSVSRHGGGQRRMARCRACGYAPPTQSNILVTKCCFAGWEAG